MKYYGILTSAFVAGLVGQAALAQVITGRLTDATGQPVALAHVFPSDSARTLLGTGTLTDTAGRFVLRGQRPTHLGFRRLGYHAEAPVRLSWTADSIDVSSVMHALPQVLAPMMVTSNDCIELGSPASPESLREAWDATLAALAAREAFQSEFSYQRRSTGYNTANGKQEPYDRTMAVHSSPAPALTPAEISAPLITYRPASPFRAGHTSMNTAYVALLLQPEFVGRHCVDAVVAGDSIGDVVVQMRERKPANPDATVKWAMHFSPNFPGPTRITFEYIIRGRTVSRAEHRFEFFSIDGFRFALESELSMTRVDPRSGKESGIALSRLSYSAFTRDRRLSTIDE